MADDEGTRAIKYLLGAFILAGALTGGFIWLMPGASWWIYGGFFVIAAGAGVWAFEDSDAKSATIEMNQRQRETQKRDD